jgi:uncharacterized delta-60 repeat protein
MRFFEPLESRLQFDGGGVDTSFGVHGTAAVDFAPVLGAGWGVNIYEHGFAQDVTGRLYPFAPADRLSDHARRLAIARLTRDGALDTTFGDHGYRVLDRGVSEFGLGLPSVFVDPASRLYIVDEGGLLWRLTSAGDIDRTFGGTGKITIPLLQTDGAATLAFDPQGRAYLGGATQHKLGQRMTVIRLTESGALDTTWAYQGVWTSPIRRTATTYRRSTTVAVEYMRFLANGQLAVAGEYTFRDLEEGFPDGFANRGTWATRLNPDGTVDSTYGLAGYADRTFRDSDVEFGAPSPLTINADGSIIGVFNGSSDAPESDDAEFGSNFKISADGKQISDLMLIPPSFDELYNYEREQFPVIVRPDGKILAAGPFSNLILCNGDGTIDPTWGTNGQTEMGTADAQVPFQLAPDGSVIIPVYDLGNPVVKLQRLWPGDAPLAQFDGKNLRAPRSTAVRFTVTWRDDDGVTKASIDSGDLRVTGPFNGQRATRSATLELIETLGGGRYRATYKLTSPGGWDATDNGVYAVALAPKQIQDVHGVSAPAARLGTFRVKIT